MPVHGAFALEEAVQDPARKQCEWQGDHSDRQEGPVEWLVLGGSPSVREQPVEVQQCDQGAGQTTFPASEGCRVNDRNQQKQRGSGYREGRGGQGRNDQRQGNGQGSAGAEGTQANRWKLTFLGVGNHGVTKAGRCGVREYLAPDATAADQ